MAATILVREAIWRVSSLLQDIDPQFTRHPEGELVNWLNDAQMAVAKFLPSAASRLDAIKLKPGSRQSIETIAAADCKPGDGTNPTTSVLGMQLLEVTRNMGSDGLTPGRTIRVVPRKTLDAQSRTWHAIAGPVVDQFTFDPRLPRYFYVSPAVPATPAVWVEVAHYAQPTRIANTGVPGAPLYAFAGVNTTPISIADEHLDDLVNYCAARAYMKNTQAAGHDAKAGMFSSLFIGSINAKATVMLGVNPNLKRLPFSPEPMGAAA
ncbi:MAG: hypothetical protein H0W48_00035 [Methylibium sp.]|nr:hypothetical protein [Methylibium sp.]